MNMRRMYQLTKGSVSKGSQVASNENYELGSNSYWAYDGKTLIINAELIMAEGQTLSVVNKELLITSEIPDEIMKRIKDVEATKIVTEETKPVISEGADYQGMILYIKKVNNKLSIFNKGSITSSVNTPRHFMAQFIIPAL